MTLCALSTCASDSSLIPLVLESRHDEGVVDWGKSGVATCCSRCPSALALAQGAMKDVMFFSGPFILWIGVPA